MKKRYIFPTVFVALFLSSNAYSVAQVDRQTGVVQPQKASTDFLEMANRLAVQERITLVFEGEPFEPKELTARDTAFVFGNAPLEQRIARFVESYDYDVERDKELFVLRKRYTNAQDLPSVTFEECAATVKEISRVMSLIDPKLSRYNSSGRYSLLDGIMPTLTEDQLIAMHNGGVDYRATFNGKTTGPMQKTPSGTIPIGLPVSDLTVSQRNEIERIARYLYIQSPLEYVNPLTVRFGEIAAQDVDFSLNGKPERQKFGYSAVGGPENHLRFIELKEQFLGQLPGIPDDPLGEWETNQEVTVTVNGSILKSPSPLDMVTASDTNRTNPSLVSSTIQQWVSTAHAASASRSDSVGTVTVDSALATKRITVVGAGNSTFPRTFRAIARLYGLRVLTDKQGNLRLTRAQPAPVRDAVRLSEALVSVFPPSLVRAWQSEKTRKEQEIESEIKNHTNRAYSAEGVKRAAVRRLRALLTPNIKASKDGHVLWSQLSEEEKQLFGLALLSDAVPGILRLVARPVPDYIAEPDQIILTGGVHVDRDGKKKFAIFLSRADKISKALIQGAGMGGATYYSK